MPRAASGTAAITVQRSPVPSMDQPSKRTKPRGSAKYLGGGLCFIPPGAAALLR